MPPATKSVPQDLYRLPVVSHCATRPARRSVAYVVTLADSESNAYRGSLRVVSLDGVARTYTYGRHLDTQPRWSANGERLFFLSDRSGKMQLWSISADGGEPLALPELDGAVSDYAVSPNGQHICAVVTPETKRRAIEQRGWRRVTRLRYRADGSGYLDDPSQLWLIDLSQHSARQITDGSGFCVAPAWSRDGTRIAFSAEHDPEADMLWHHELWVAHADSDFRPKQISHMGGALEVPAWSPDGNTIAFIGLASARGAAGLKNMRLFTVAQDGSGLRCWTPEAEWTASNLVLTDTGTAGNTPAPAWLSDSCIAVVGSTHGCARLFAVSLDLPVRALTPATHSVVEFTCVDASTFVLVATDSATPPELYLWREDNDLHPLTNETEHWSATLGLRRPVRFSVDGPAGLIDAWYLAGARGDAPRPAVLQIHGGPHFSYGEAFVFEFQLLAACGFDVVYCNPRGSQGYGEAFAGSIVGDWATPAFLDCMAVLEQALQHHAIDARRVAVAGGSYGGYLTAWAIGHSTRFAAAIAMRPATNLTSLWGTSEVGRMLNDELGGTPSEIPEVYRSCSPLTYADAMTTPLLITQAENDYRCPSEQAEQLFSALRVRGQTVELMRFLNADHGMSRTGPPQSRVARLEAIIAWLTRFLLPGERAPAHDSRIADVTSTAI